MDMPFNCELRPDNSVYSRDTNVAVNFGFRDYAFTLGHTQPMPITDVARQHCWYEFVKLFGLPVTGELKLPGDPKTYQVFERTVLCYDPTIQDPAWRIQGIHLGLDWLANLKKSPTPPSPSPK